MSSLRLMMVAVVVGAVAVLALSFDGGASSAGSSLRSAPVPVAGQPTALSSTWFCAAGAAPTAEPPKHQLLMVNPAGQVAEARLTAYGADGLVDSVTVEVPTPGPLVVDVSETFGAADLSVMVESDAGELVVEHRLVAPGAADQVACATTSSASWYFPAQSSVKGATAQLVLFNPFSADASVDISAAVQDGIRVPGEWQGLVVPAGSRRVVDLGAEIQRREIFSVAVQTRNGRVIAETAQLLAIESPLQQGLRLQLGVRAPASRWAFADGFTGQGATERLVVFNPGRRAAVVAVQVTPFGGAALPPEPFQLEVPPRRYVSLDLSAESRIPGEGFHSIQVQSDDDVGVVVGRVVTLSGAAAAPSGDGIITRPDLSGGTSIGTATPVAAPLWVVTGYRSGGGQQSSVAVFNAGTGIVVMSATVLGGPSDGTPLASDVEIAPGDSLVVGGDGTDLGPDPVTVLVEASSPVVVERLIPFPAQNDLSMSLAVPLPNDPGDLVPVGG